MKRTRMGLTLAAAAVLLAVSACSSGGARVAASLPAAR